MMTLGVRDLERSVRFYRDGLGFPMMDSPPEVAFFPLNGSWLALFGRDALAEDAGLAPEGDGFRCIALAHNVHSNAEVDALMHLAEQAGATITRPAEKAPWGGYRGYFADPDGHLWEVAHNPFFWIGPSDEES